MHKQPILRTPYTYSSLFKTLIPLENETINPAYGSDAPSVGYCYSGDMYYSGNDVVTL